MEKLNLETFIDRFRKIKDKGWIKTHRSGTTGVGKTLEDLLGISENNIQGPDYGIYEIKSKRINSGSMMTIFTKSPEPRGSNTELRNNYGYSSNAYDNTEKVLHSTLNTLTYTPISNTGKSLKITLISDRLHVESSDKGVLNIYWPLSTLREKFDEKLGGQFIYVKAESRGEGANEEFLFVSAHLISGITFDKVVELIRLGKLYVDIRIGQYPDGRTHDHGTGFRIREIDEELLFEKRIRLD